MIKKYLFWFKGASFLQLLTGFFHLLGFLKRPLPENNKERLLFDLMHNYKFDFGQGFTRSMMDIMNAFSLTFSLFLLFSGILNLYLIKCELSKNTFKGIILINFI